MTIDDNANSDSKSEGVGLAATGSSGNWQIDVDQSIAEPEKWYLQITGYSAELYVEIPSLTILEDLQTAANALLQCNQVTDLQAFDVGKVCGVPVEFVADPNSASARLLMLSADSTNVGITLRDVDVAQLCAAVEQVIGELRNEGCL